LGSIAWRPVKNSSSTTPKLYTSLRAERCPKPANRIKKKKKIRPIRDDEMDRRNLESTYRNCYTFPNLKEKYMKVISKIREIHEGDEQNPRNT
jgi:hypothetical protein